MVLKIDIVKSGQIRAPSFFHLFRVMLNKL